MREYAVTGRAAAQTLIQQYSAVSVPASDPASQSLQRRAIQMLQTYAGSFDRETAMAGELQAIATLLRDPRSIAAVEPEIDRHTEMFGAMDNDRLVDATRRQAIMSQN